MTSDKSNVLTKYHILMTQSKTTKVTNEPLTKKTADERIEKLRNNSFNPPYKISYEIVPVEIKLPKAGLPIVGDSLYVPGGLENTLISSGLDKVFIKRIIGGLATVNSLRCVNDEFWVVDFKELTYPNTHTGCADLSEDRVPYLLESLQKNQSRYERLYGKREARIICDRDSARGAVAGQDFRDSNEGDWK
ncbi:MAG: hypothetical protein WCK29_01525 [archaeon]